MRRCILITLLLMAMGFVLAQCEFIAISAGENHSIAIRADSTVWAWGQNSMRQLGDGATSNHSHPVQVQKTGGVALDDVIAIASGSNHNLALLEDGTVYSWGWNMYGQLGDGTAGAYADRARAVLVETEPGVPLSNVIAIAGGYGHSLALRNDGTVWAWGWNKYGQLGVGDTIHRYRPVRVETDTDVPLSDVVVLAAGGYDNVLGYGHSLAVREDGTVYVWGHNRMGQLGDGTEINRLRPVLCPLTNVATLACGAVHSLAFLEDRAVYAWGCNSWGQLGDGTGADRSFPVRVLASSGVPLANVITIAAGSKHSLAILDDGAELEISEDQCVYAWGSNSRGQIGDGGTGHCIYPTRVEIASGVPLRGAFAIAGGGEHSLALKDDGTVWAWGCNDYGQLGDTTTTQRRRPVQVICTELPTDIKEQINPQNLSLNTFPNPFNSSCQIVHSENTIVKIYDIRGQLVDKLLEGQNLWTPSKLLSSGLYFATTQDLSGNEKQKTKRIMYIK